NSYHDLVGAFPMSYAARNLAVVNGMTDTAQGWGWATMILPQMEQSAAYNAVNSSLAVEAPQNSTMIRMTVAGYLCPSDPTSGPFVVSNGAGNTLATAAPSSYAACVGGDESDTSTGINNDGLGTGVMFRNSRIRVADIIDGTTYTILVGERAWSNSNGVWAG